MQAIARFEIAHALYVPFAFCAGFEDFEDFEELASYRRTFSADALVRTVLLIAIERFSKITLCTPVCREPTVIKHFKQQCSS